MRQAARIDANQPEIVKGLRGVGASVAITSMVGNGFVDIIVGHHGRNFLFEIKDGSKPPSKRKLTEDEQEFHDTWRGTVFIINSLDEALEILGVEYDNNND